MGLVYAGGYVYLRPTGHWGRISGMTNPSTRARARAGDASGDSYRGGFMFVAVMFSSSVRIPKR